MRAGAFWFVRLRVWLESGAGALIGCRWPRCVWLLACGLAVLELEAVPVLYVWRSAALCLWPMLWRAVAVDFAGLQGRACKALGGL